jgi:hypothetical protein
MKTILTATATITLTAAMFCGVLWVALQSV